MQLRVRTWGDGPRTALLVHGFSDDAETWWQVAPAVAEHGFTVLVPDLRGHGRSPRAESYALAEFADDLVASLPGGVDLALGHSLGGIVLGLAAERLQPRRAVFVDPPWSRAVEDLRLVRPLATTPAQLPAGWSAQDAAVDLASNALVDPSVALALEAELLAVGVVPVPAPVGRAPVVLVPGVDPALSPVGQAAARTAGYEVLTQPGAGHVMHRDDVVGFLALLRPLLAAEGAAA